MLLISLGLVPFGLRAVINHRPQGHSELAFGVMGSLCLELRHPCM